MDWWVGGWVKGGFITFFNVYVSLVKKIQNEDRDLLRDFFLEILCCKVFTKQKPFHGPGSTAEDVCYGRRRVAAFLN